jgi:predicted dehydrogenase
MKRRHLLVVGLGSIGQRHVRNLRALAGDELVLSAWRVRKEPNVLGDRMLVEADSGLEERYGLQTYETLDAALDARPDAVLICNPTALHLPVARAAAERGVNLFLEKPVSHDLAGVEELAALTEAMGLVTLVGFQMRFHPCFAAVRHLLARRALGRVLSARLLVGEWLPGFHPWEDYRAGYAARKELGGGVVLTLSHEIDAALALFGPARRVFSLGGHLSSLALDVEDVASTLLECACEGRPLPVHVQQDYVQRPARRSWEVVGDAGRIEVDLTVPSVSFVPIDGEPTLQTFPAFERSQLFRDEMQHFLRCLDRTETPAVTLRDAVGGQRTLVAIQESISTGRVIDLP